jgi:FkbM family methyltransferase
MPTISYSILKEDILLLRAIGDISHQFGFYIDVGANDPEQHSVTKLFYDHGWRGINIEPSNHWYERLVAERPRDINVHAAASDKPGRLTLYDHPEGGLGTLVEAFADRHVQDFDIPKRGVEIEAVTLTQLCEEYAPAQIHFLKIDVEGHEEQVIRGMDFARYRPWILCVEATEPMRPSAHTHEAWDPLLISAGYRFVLFDGLNRWYLAEEHSERAPKLSYPVDNYVHYTQLNRISELEHRISELESISARLKIRGKKGLANIDAQGEVEETRTERGAKGHAVYGPYEDLAPGSYEVCFHIAAAEDETGGDDDPICAVLDVVSDNGVRDIAATYVVWSQLGPDSEFRLSFDLDEPRRRCEYRIYSTGAAPLLISGRPVVTRREPPDAESRGCPGGQQSTIKHLWEQGVRADLRGQDIVIRARQLDEFVANVLKLQANRGRLAEQVVEAAGYRGVSENSLYRAFVGTERASPSPPQPVPFTSSLCQQEHFGYAQYRYWANALKETPKYQRKQWEFVFIAQTLYEQGFLEPGMRGIVFGAGEEQLPALFASFGVKVLATDQASDQAAQKGWVASNQYAYDLSTLNKRSICTDRMFSELVSFRPVDMNDIPTDLDEQFDFCWSACALEHLGSLEHGLAFMENSMRTLRPGGLAIHTTEFNLSSDDDTIETPNLSIYRRQDIDAFVDRMARKGFEVAPMDWEVGEGFAEMVVDLAPYLARGEPHIRLRAGDYDTTSIGLIIRKPVQGASIDRRHRGSLETIREALGRTSALANNPPPKPDQG